MRMNIYTLSALSLEYESLFFIWYTVMKHSVFQIQILG